MLALSSQQPPSSNLADDGTLLHAALCGTGSVHSQVFSQHALCLLVFKVPMGFRRYLEANFYLEFHLLIVRV